MAAAAWTSGSCAACSLIVQWRSLKNSGFSVRVSGVGGFVVDVPIASELFGGVVGRNESRYERGLASSCS